jgi:hypothetical protein
MHQFFNDVKADIAEFFGYNSDVRNRHSKEFVTFSVLAFAGLEETRQDDFLLFVRTSD